MLKLYCINRSRVIKQRNIFLILLILVLLLNSNKKSTGRSNVTKEFSKVLSKGLNFEEVKTCNRNPKTLNGELKIKNNPVNFGAFFINMTKEEFIFLKKIENGNQFLINFNIFNDFIFNA